MIFTIPELSLVVLIGPSGAGKSTFTRTHFKPTEVLTSDVCRGLVSDDENNQAVTRDAFAVSPQSHALSFVAPPPRPSSLPRAPLNGYNPARRNNHEPHS